MPPNNSKSKPQNTRLKIIVAVGLALILGAVMMESGEQPAAEAETSAARNRPPAKKKPAIDPDLLLASRPTKPLARIPLEAVVQYSPFEIEGRIAGLRPLQSTTGSSTNSGKSSSGEQKPAAPHPAIANLRGMKADIILESSNGRSARIGPRIVHEGAFVVEGATVRTIDDSGALIELQFIERPAQAKLPRSARE